jgi:hypothetical protein
LVIAATVTLPSLCSPLVTANWTTEAQEAKIKAVAECDRVVDGWIPQFVQTLNASIRIYGKPYIVKQFPVNATLCFAVNRDQVKELTNRLCKPPYGLYVTCNPDDRRPAGEPMHLQFFFIRAAARDEGDFSQCECHGPPIETDDTLGLPPATPTKLRTKPLADPNE